MKSTQGVHKSARADWRTTCSVVRGLNREDTHVVDQCFHFCLPCIVDGLRRKQIRANGASSGTAINRFLRYLRVSTRDAGRCAYACVGTLGIGATLPVDLVLIPQMPQGGDEAAKLREQWHLSDRTHGQRSRHHSQPAGCASERTSGGC